jgi:hypothetical protein
VNLEQMRRQLADMELKEGYAYSTHEVEAMRRTIADYTEQLSVEDWTQLAWDTLRDGDHYGSFTEAEVEKAANAVAARWQSEGHELSMTRDGARRLAMQVGNHLYSGSFGGGYDPEQVGVKREPEKLFGRELPKDDAK